MFSDIYTLCSVTHSTSTSGVVPYLAKEKQQFLARYSASEQCTELTCKSVLIMGQAVKNDVIVSLTRDKPFHCSRPHSNNKGPYTPSNPTESDLLNVGRKLQIV
jgi:hypothetical protein